MNTLYKSFVLAALLTTCTLARAYDFEAGGLYYNIMSVSECTAEVTYQGDAYPTVYLNAELYVPEGSIQSKEEVIDTKPIEIPGYATMNYWKNFQHIKEGEPNSIRQTAAAANERILLPPRQVYVITAEGRSVKVKL